MHGGDQSNNAAFDIHRGIPIDIQSSAPKIRPPMLLAAWPLLKRIAALPFTKSRSPKATDGKPLKGNH